MLGSMNRRRFVANLANRSLALSLLPTAPMLLGQGCASAPRQAKTVVDDADGSLGRTQAPVCVTMQLPAGLSRAAAEGRLATIENASGSSKSESLSPVQLIPGASRGTTRLGWRLPPGRAGQRGFSFTETSKAPPSVMAAQLEPDSGQYLITESGASVLRYNYAQVEPGKIYDSVAPGNRKYAVARSNYLHPLWGPHGEELTRDWSVDHPHHRGIYWAWPEVGWRGQQGDLHALQLVFARPTGRCVATSGPLFAQIDAENIWRWESGEEIVRERAIIRAWRDSGNGRLVDLEFHFSALHDPVTLARRGTDKYGGLNIRLAAVRNQVLTREEPRAEAIPRRSWADVSGMFPGAENSAGVTTLQIQSNPDYPGDWIEYPELNWLQPTFPAAGTRYTLEPGRNLVLRYRLWIHSGSTLTRDAAADHWQAANSFFSPAVQT